MTTLPRSRVELGLLGACLLTACSTGDSQLAETAPALTGGSPCDGVELDASRLYRPRGWTDGQVSFAAGSLTFVVPWEIPVTAGASDHGKTKLTFSREVGVPVTCVYRGNGADRYLFVKCKQAEVRYPDLDDDDADHDDGPADALPTAGSTVTADAFTLHVNRGKRAAGTTSVRLHLAGPVISDEDACTTDACTAEGGVSHTPIDLDDQNACTTDTCDAASGPRHTLVDTGFCRGEVSFDGALATGNGRACTTCHIESDSFTLVPATVEARFQALLLARQTDPTADDPLFRSVDADDLAQDFTHLRKGLARVSIPLPPNITVDELPGATEISIFRGVPSIFNLALTSRFLLVDGRAASLQAQALDASRVHIQVATDPSEAFRDDVAAYELGQFSSQLVADLAARVAAGETPPTAEPPLDALELDGKARFEFRCGACHGGPSLSAGPATDMPGAGGTPGTFRNVSVSLPNNPHRDPTLPTFTFRVIEAGVVKTVISPDPGRMLITGKSADANRFDVPTLYGISRTAPYFHDNSAKDLTEVMDQYQAEFARQRAAPILNTDPAVGELTPDDNAAIIAYLRRL